MLDISNLDAVTGKPQTGSARQRMSANPREPVCGTPMPRLDCHEAGSPCSTLTFCCRWGHSAAARRSSPTPAAAYEALNPEAGQATLEGLRAEHTFMHSRSVLDASRIIRRSESGPHWPRWCNRWSLRIRARAGNSGLCRSPTPRTSSTWRSRMDACCLMELDGAGDPCRGTTYRWHEWQVGDLVMWG